MTVAGVDVPRSLTDKQLIAALMVAEGRLSDEEVGFELGLSRETIKTWKRKPEFSTAVEAHRQKTAVVLAQYDISQRSKRLGDYQAMRDQLVIDFMEAEPPERRKITVSLLAVLKQGSIESGDWLERTETTHTGNVSFTINLGEHTNTDVVEGEVIRSLTDDGQKDAESPL